MNEVEHNGFNIYNAGFSTLKKVKTIGRGSLPDELKGAYTSYEAAKKAIDSYVRTKKVKSDGKKG